MELVHVFVFELLRVLRVKLNFVKLRVLFAQVILFKVNHYYINSKILLSGRTLSQGCQHALAPCLDASRQTILCKNRLVKNWAGSALPIWVEKVGLAGQMYRDTPLDCQDWWKITLIISNHHIILFPYLLLAFLHFPKFESEIFYLKTCLLVLPDCFNNLLFEGISALCTNLVFNFKVWQFLFEVWNSVCVLVRTQFLLFCKILI